MKYNLALDYLALAAQKAAQGKPNLAARFLAQASKAPDLDRCIALIEANNNEAFTAQASTKISKASKTTASKTSKATKTSTKAATKTTAATRILAELEDEDDDVKDLMADAVEDDDMDMGDEEGEEVGAADEEEDEGEGGDFDEQLASTLASMTRPRRRR